jgi:outer membrane receptor protein involved in Fe transport
LNLAPHDLLDLDTGLEFRHEWVGSIRRDAPSSRGNFSDGSTFGTVDGWLWADLRPLWPDFAPGPRDDRIRVKLGGGLRATAVFAHAPEVPGLGDVDYDFTGIVGAMKASLLVGSSVHLWTGFSRGFRAPNLQESTVLGDTGSTFELPNASLRPQRNDTFDVGLRMQSRAASLGAVGFITTVTDAIVREPATFEGASEVDGKDVFRRTNATRVDYHGLEIQLGLGPVDGLSLETSLGLIDGTLTEQRSEEHTSELQSPMWPA